MSKMENRIHKLFGLLPCALAAAMLLVSCDRDEISSEKRVPVTFSVKVDVAPTKAPVTTYEDIVRTVDILVFKAFDGTLDARTRVTSGTDPVLSVTSDVDLVWYVVANVPAGRFDAVARLSDLTGDRVALTENTTSALVMFDSGTMKVTATSGPIEVKLKRYCSKVSVKQIEVPYLDKFSTPPTVLLRRIALVNAGADIPFSGASGTEGWYNKMGVDASLTAFVKGMLVAEYGDYAVTSSSAFGVVEPLYAMPNAVSNSVDSSTAPEWSPRPTRVAVELVINGVSNWYAMSLPAMEPNHHYVINKVTILGPGGPGPDMPVLRDDVRFGISILPWGAQEGEVTFPTT